MSYKTRSLIAAASLVVAAAVPQLAQASTVTSVMNFDSLADFAAVGNTYANLIAAGQGFTYEPGATAFDVVHNSGTSFGTPPSPSNILANLCGDLCPDLSFHSTADIIGIDFSGFIVGGGEITATLSGIDSAGNATSKVAILDTKTSKSWEKSVNDFSNIVGLRWVSFSAGAGTFGLDDIIVRTVAASTGGGGGNVPEPASLMLAGLGLAGLLASRRGKKA